MDEATRLYLDEKFSNLKREISVETTESIKKLKPLKEFKRLGNKKQFIFNKELDDTLATAKKELSEARLEKAVEALDKGSQQIAERNKLILLADQSEFGWGTVAEYVEHDLADDSEDEKRIRRAEACAGRKRRDTTKAKQQRSKTYSRTRPGQPYNMGGGVRSITTVGSQQRNFRPSSSDATGGNAMPPGAAGACFSCGSMEHWRNTCPKLRKC